MAAEDNRIANLRSLVDELAGEAGGKLRQGYRAIATATGLDEEYVYQLYKGIKKSMGPDAAKAIARAYANGRNPNWIDLPNQAKHHVGVESVSPAPEPGSPSIQVALLANRGSMGPGNDALHDDVMVGAISLSPEWVSKRIRPTSASALRFIHAYGDSMSSTFEDGDILLVDTGAINPSSADGVYVLLANHRVFIKRVTERMGGGFDVTNDNPKVKTVDDLDGSKQITVLGRVVWVWNGKKI